MSSNVRRSGSPADTGRTAAAGSAVAHGSRIRGGRHADGAAGRPILASRCGIASIFGMAGGRRGPGPGRVLVVRFAGRRGLPHSRRPGHVGDRRHPFLNASALRRASAGRPGEARRAAFASGADTRRPVASWGGAGVFGGRGRNGRSRGFRVETRRRVEARRHALAAGVAPPGMRAGTREFAMRPAESGDRGGGFDGWRADGRVAGAGCRHRAMRLPGSGRCPSPGPGPVRANGHRGVSRGRRAAPAREPMPAAGTCRGSGPCRPVSAALQAPFAGSRRPSVRSEDRALASGSRRTPGRRAASEHRGNGAADAHAGAEASGRRGLRSGGVHSYGASGQRSAAMLSATRAADSLTESRAR